MNDIAIIDECRCMTCSALIRQRGMKNWYVGNNAAWFVVRARLKSEARREGREEFGHVSEVHEATDSELREFIANKGRDAIEELD